MAILYFGYGSNLWQEQMLLRCPTSQYQGIARLPDYRWIINARGYANIVQIPQPESTETTEDPSVHSQTKTSSHQNESWGLVYSLQPSDEARLDINEGVPEAYTKEMLEVDFWPTTTATSADSSEHGLGEQVAERRRVLVYIDRKRTLPDEPWPEYIYRMNRGVKDALMEGVPAEYVGEVIRKFIPEDEERDEAVEVLARRQAGRFEDEGR